MGMFDHIKVGDDTGSYQSKDGPCGLYIIDRDAVDDNGAYIINYYYGRDGEVQRRGPDGWVETRELNSHNLDVPFDSDRLIKWEEAAEHPEWNG